MVPELYSRLFTLTLGHIPDPIFIKDEQSRILHANQAFLDLLAPEGRDGVLGRTLTENFSAAEAELFLAEDRRAFALGQSEMTEEIIDHAGRRFVFLTRKIVFRSPEGHPRLFGHARNITELADREAALVRANAQLQSFAAMAAHDLRSPLASAISGLALIRRDRGTTLSDSAATFVTLISDTLLHLTESVRTLLAVSQAEHDGLESDRSDYDLNVMLAEIKFALTDVLEKRNATVTSNRLPIVAVNPALYRQLLQNLIENSIKYGRKDQPVRVIVRSEETAAGHEFSVEDNGVGLTAAIAERAFSLHEQGNRASEGAGIGLALCRKIVTLHGGSIWFDPSFSDGCCVRFTLPSSEAPVQVLEAA